MSKVILVLLGCVIVTIVQAEDFYSQHARGWHWYDDPVESHDSSQPQVKDRINPSQQIHLIRQKVLQALDRAILNPTPQHITQFMRLQNQLSARAAKFSELWQQILLQHPELNFSVAHPTSGIALQVYHAKRYQATERAIKKFSEQTGLFFFYRSRCVYCQRFSPILKNFANHYGITVIPITLDGVSLPEFPHSRTDQGQSKQFQLKVEPSLFAVNPYTQQAVVVSYGLVTADQLRDRILQIIEHQQRTQA